MTDENHAAADEQSGTVPAAPSWPPRVPSGLPACWLPAVPGHLDHRHQFRSCRVPARIRWIGGGKAIAMTAEVPVGGGVIIDDKMVVVTQPKKGDFKAFTSVCPHEGCTVGSVTDDVILCPCHGSRFSRRDGRRAAGAGDDRSDPGRHHRRRGLDRRSDVTAAEGSRRRGASSAVTKVTATRL